MTIVVNVPYSEWYSESPSNPFWRINEPAGLAELTEKSFDTLTELETSNDPNWYITSTTSLKTIAIDTNAPQSPSNVLRHTYPAGFAGGFAGTSAGFTGSTSTELYVCLAVRWDPNWEPHPTGTNKVLFITSSTFGGGGDPLFLSMNTQQAANRLILTTQGAGMYGSLPRVVDVDLIFGNEYIVEIHLIANSSYDLEDGIAKMWVTDVTAGTPAALVHDLANVTFYTDQASTGQFNNVKLEPTWGGGGGVTVGDFYLEHDHIFISGA